MRGFEVAKGYDSSETIIPRRSTKHSAGYDFTICQSVTLAPGEIKKAATGIKAYMQEDEVLSIVPRSSLPDRYGVTIPNNVGIIDADYYSNPNNDGAIFIQLYNFSNVTVTIPGGTRIAQGIFQKYLIVSGEKVSNTTRNGGFGSTGSGLLR